MPQEIRSGLPVEIRESENVIKVSGYAAVFNQDAEIGCLLYTSPSPRDRG